MRFLVCILCLLLIACGDGERIPGPDDGLTPSPFGAGSGGSCDELSESATQTGSKLFSGVDMGGFTGDRNIEVSFSLAKEGSITFHAYAANDLSKGVDIQFKRNQDDSLGVEVGIGNSKDDYSDLFSGISACGSQKFFIDVHNSEGTTHVIIWAASAAGSSFAIDDALYDSHGGDGHTWFTRGGGEFLGLSVNKGLYQNPVVGPTKNNH